MNNKEFKQVVKSAKVDLKKEVTSVSFWINTICKAAQSGDCRKAVIHVLSVEKLPTKEELKKLLLNRALNGFKFYDKDDNILVNRKTFQKDENGEIVRMEGKPIIKDSWYEVKKTFTFLSVWGAIFAPAKNKQVIESDLIK